MRESGIYQMYLKNLLDRLLALVGTAALSWLLILLGIAIHLDSPGPIFFRQKRAAEPEKVYSNGYSGGGETLALILGKKPELFTAALMCSSKWDGAYEPVTEAKTPVYFVIGESDEYYGSEPFKEAYQILYELYAEQGLAKSEIDNLLVLDIKEKNYFAGTKVTYQHGGGYLFCRDEKNMGWLFGH